MALVALEAGDATDEPAALRPTYIPLAAAEVPIYSRYWWHSDGTLALRQEVERAERFSRTRSELPIDSTVALLMSLEFAGDLKSQAHMIVNYPEELACYRDFAYFFVLAAEDESEFYVFLTNHETTPIAELMGEHYSRAAARQFEAVGYARTIPLQQDRRWRNLSGRRHCRIVSDPMTGMELPP